GNFGGPRPLVVVCHGFTGTKEGQGKALAMAEALGATTGWATLLFDFAGNGESEGNFSDLTLSGQIADLTAAVDLAESLGYGPIVTLGRSFGGTTVLCQAPQDQRVRAVCTWSAVGFPRRSFPRARAKPTAEGVLAWDSILGVRVYLKEEFFADLERYDVLDCVRRISPRPVLLCHGDRDEVVPVGDVYALWQAAREPKQLLVVPGADHVYSEHYEKVWQTFFRWLMELDPQKHLHRSV
ncbi:MAG: alpha/beta hydrolase, partial [Clostridia bacterium]|nr:alpha/beta hydrolase [Clostridia bacterium]